MVAGGDPSEAAVMKATWLGCVLGSILLAAPAARADVTGEPAGRAIDDAHVERAGADDDEDAGGGYAPLARSLVERLRFAPQAVVHLGGPRLPESPARAGSFDQEFDLDRPFAFALPAPSPDGLRIDVTVGRVTAYVWADMTSELPRLDAVDEETYFTPGLEVTVTPGLRLFVEDFQPASGVIGGADEEEPAPARSWDGHQAAGGLRWDPLPGMTIEVAALGHVLSATRRAATPGGMASLTLRF